MIEFSERTDARGRLIVCTYDGEVGTARVDSKGVEVAKQRAEAQARKKASERGPA